MGTETQRKWTGKPSTTQLLVKKIIPLMGTETRYAVVKDRTTRGLPVKKIIPLMGTETFAIVCCSI